MSECCVHCTSEGCSAIAYCVDDTQPPPCRHDTGACGDCNLTACSLCREEEMHASGVYDPAADPFYVGPRPTALTVAEVIAETEAHLAERQRVSGFNPATNSYERPSA